MKKLFLFFIVLFFTKTPVFADGYITQNIIDGCNSSNLHYTNNTTNLIPVFRAKTYTCNSGYFLPANTVDCVACPNGYTCNGGTFEFDEKKVQGIKNFPTQITQNTNKVCSVNLLHSSNNITNMKPIFRPKSVTLNFNDDNGNTTQTTCTYDNLINLPSTPSRAGYDFVGWKVENNN